jgi:four helix bundle protein
MDTIGKFYVLGFKFMGYRSFEELEVWKLGCRLAVRVYEVLKECRDFGLKDQMTRAAVSISSNIAEGAERDSKQEFVRFLHIAKGSAAELRTQVYIACQIGIISNDIQKEFTEELKKISSMLHGLIKSIKT